MTQIPQLLLTGFGSIDDPEGHAIYQQTLEFIDSEEFSDIERDIIACRLPPSDRLMNALLQCTRICLQLSMREGFEIKVTEALAKGVPVIAYRTGGLSNQIRDEETGFLVEAGDTEKVAHRLKSLLMDHDLYASMSKKAKKCLNPQLSTPFQATNWLWLWNHVYQEKRAEEPDMCVMQDGVTVAEKVAERDVAQMWYHNEV